VVDPVMMNPSHMTLFLTNVRW